MNRRRRCYNLVTLKIVHSWSLPFGNAVILNHKCNGSVDRFCRINVLWLPLWKSSLINCVVSFSEAVHQKCRSCPKQIRVKKVTNMDLSKPPQIGGRAVSRSRGLENNFFLHPKPFSENSHTGHSKNVQFLRFRAIFGRENGSRS